MSSLARRALFRKRHMPIGSTGPTPFYAAELHVSIPLKIHNIDHDEMPQQTANLQQQFTTTTMGDDRDAPVCVDEPLERSENAMAVVGKFVFGLVVVDDANLTVVGP